ncbi:MAG: hypothetical protein LBI05_05930 [Planctomycetaceae bacterium]|jgi:hypothetical protein|nr:hypothetical protein [Planctomycetaceae bacterium]
MPSPPSRTSAEIRSLLHERLDALLDESDIVAKNAALTLALSQWERGQFVAGLRHCAIYIAAFVPRSFSFAIK